MRLLRSLLYYALLLIAAVPVGIGCLLTWPVTSAKWRYDVFERPYMRFAVQCARVICGLEFEVRGLENVPVAGERVVIFCKHQSAWETLFLPAYIPGYIAYVYKESLHWIPFFGWAAKSMQMIPIDRKNGRLAFEQIMHGGARLLNTGWWIGIFPEGTRVAPGATSIFKTGGARFAVRQKAKVLPIAVNSGEFWAKNALEKTPGKIIVSIGPAIDTQGRDFNEVNYLASTWIEEEVRRIGNPRFYDASLS